MKIEYNISTSDEHPINRMMIYAELMRNHKSLEIKNFKDNKLVGGLTYILHYQHVGTETLDCLLDPADIGAVADGDGAIRCLQYFVHGAWTGTNGSIYHSSTYAAKTDEQWNEARQEVVKFFSAAIERLQNEINAVNII